MVVYGIKGYYNDILVEVYDWWYLFENGKFNFYLEIVLSNELMIDKNLVIKKYVDIKVKKIWYRGNLVYNNKKIVEFYVNGIL